MITDDPRLARRSIKAVAPPAATAPQPPTAARCSRTQANRWPLRSRASIPTTAVRACSRCSSSRSCNVATYAAFRTKIECMIREYVVPRLARRAAERRRLQRGRRADDDRDRHAAGARRGRSFADRGEAPGCEDAPRAVRRARRARRDRGRATRSRRRAYEARFPRLARSPAPFVAATDTFARGWMQTFCDMARRYDVYILGSNNQAPFRESIDPSEIEAFADPDLPRPPRASSWRPAPRVYNEVFMWGPRDVRREGPRPLRNVVARNRKVPLTSIEQQLEPDARADDRPRRDRERRALPDARDPGADRRSRPACPRSSTTAAGTPYGERRPPASIPARTPPATTCAASTSSAPTW